MISVMQSFGAFPEFSMILATESQFRALYVITVKHRMLHMDATDKLNIVDLLLKS